MHRLMPLVDVPKHATWNYPILKVVARRCFRMDRLLRYLMSVSKPLLRCLGFYHCQLSRSTQLHCSWLVLVIGGAK
jgi:hypothetical protein